MAYPSNRPAPDVTFLIDECLNDALSKTARDQGFDGYHVRRIGLGGTPDKLIAEYAVANGMIVVTNDARDYRAIYRRFVSHPGLVIVLPSVNTYEQIRLFQAVLDFIEAAETIVDQLVEVNEAGEITVKPWPQPRA
jgi:predicted nuclease of predicted toxin-antitoxin system